MTRVRRAARAAGIYGQLRAALAIVDDVHDLDTTLADLTPEEIELAGDLSIARHHLRAARDRLYDQVRRDTDALDRLELELDRVADE